MWEILLHTAVKLYKVHRYQLIVLASEQCSQCTVGNQNIVQEINRWYMSILM